MKNKPIFTDYNGFGGELVIPGNFHDPAVTIEA
jgi:hypothetical protein